jgi:hypothetical protein
MFTESYRLPTYLGLHKYHLKMGNTMTDFKIQGSIHHMAKAPSYNVRRTGEKQQEVANTDCESLC